MAKRFNRHFPRLCRSCGAPMARQEDACWSCGAVWADRATPAGKVTVPGAAIHAPVPTLTSDKSASTPEHAGLLILDTDRWTDEGGSAPSEAPAPALVPAAAQR